MPTVVQRTQVEFPMQVVDPGLPPFVYSLDMVMTAETRPPTPGTSMFRGLAHFILPKPALSGEPEAQGRRRAGRSWAGRLGFIAMSTPLPLEEGAHPCSRSLGATRTSLELIFSPWWGGGDAW